MQVTPNWKVNVDAKCTDWGDWDGITVEIDKPLGFLKLAGPLSPYATKEVPTVQMNALTSFTAPMWV